MRAIGGLLLRTALGQSVLAALALLIIVPAAYHAWRWKVSRDAAAAVMARVLAETKAESDRRLKALDIARRDAERLAEDLAAADAHRLMLMGEIDALSRANDDSVCLPADSVRRLDAIRGRPAGAGARKPAR